MPNDYVLKRRVLRILRIAYRYNDFILLLIIIRTILPGIMTLMTTGLIIGSTIFNMDFRSQAWTFRHSESTILLATISFYIAAVIGSIAGYLLVERYEKKPISVRFGIFFLKPS